jgi:phosphohistidine phosphatase
MYLYLIQHGEATSEETNPLRPLSEKGRSDVVKVTGFMKKVGITASEIWHSTKLRAKQTAEIVAETLALRITEKEGLAPNDPPAQWVDRILKMKEDVIIVSHLPFLQKFVSHLITGSESNEVIKFRQGGMVCLERTDSRWSVIWIILPELL